METLPGFGKLIILYIESRNKRISRAISIALCGFEGSGPDKQRRDDKLETGVESSTITYGERRRASNLFFQYMTGNWPSSGLWGAAGELAMAGGGIV